MVTAAALSTNTYVTLTGVDEVASRTELSVYPNPANATLNIRYTSNTEQSYQYALLNAIGEILITGTLSNATKQGPLTYTRFPRGIYLLQLRTEEETVGKMLLVE